MTDTDYASEGSQDAAADAIDEAAVEALRAETAALKEQALRYAAEAENTRRRAEREINDARAYAISKFAKDLQLQFLWHLRQLSGTGGIEDDLEGAHWNG